MDSVKMVSVGIIAAGSKEDVIEAINLIQQIQGLKVVFIKQSDEKLYIVTDRVFKIIQEGDNEK